MNPFIVIGFDSFNINKIELIKNQLCEKQNTVISTIQKMLYTELNN